MTEDDLRTLRRAQVREACGDQPVEKARRDPVEPKIPGRAQRPFVDRLHKARSLGRRQRPPLDEHLGQGQKILHLACREFCSWRGSLQERRRGRSSPNFLPGGASRQHEGDCPSENHPEGLQQLTPCHGIRMGSRSIQDSSASDPGPNVDDIICCLQSSLQGLDDARAHRESVPSGRPAVDSANTLRRPA